MQLVDELTDLLSSPSAGLESALLKAQILAHRLGELEMKAWVESELKGYAGGAELPSYRVLPLSVMGNASNEAYRFSGQMLPTRHLEPRIRKILEERRVTESIAVVEAWSKNEEDITISIAPEYYGFLNKGLGNGYKIERAWGKPSMGAMLQIVTEVRARLLDLALGLSDKIPAGAPAEEMKDIARAAHVGELFRNSIFGDNTTIVVGSGSIQGVTNNVVKNDIASLFAALRESGVSEADIEALNGAIKEDQGAEEHASQKLGPKVRGWVGAMVAKAGTAAWTIGIGAAGGLLTKIIASYYGFGG